MTTTTRFTFLLLIFSLYLPLSLAATPDTEPQSEWHLRQFQKVFGQMTPDERSSIRRDLSRYADSLDTAIARMDEYDRRKLQRVAHLKSRLTPDLPLRRQYELSDSLYDESFHLCYDSIYAYANRCIALAEALGDRELELKARLKQAQAFIAAGYFREAEHAVDRADTTGCSRSARIRYLTVRFNLEFENGFFFPWYMYDDDKALQSMEALYADVVPLLPAQSATRHEMQAKMAFHRHDYRTAVAHCALLMSLIDKDSDAYIDALGNMGYNMLGLNNFKDGTRYMMESAVRAIRRGHKNYPALRKIAETMYVVGDIEHAYLYSNLSMRNSVTYNSKYRIVEASKGLFPITNTLHSLLKREQTNLKAVVIGLVLLAVLLIALAAYAFYQRRKLSLQEKALVQTNKELNRKNENIRVINAGLNETHHIIGILVGHMLSANARQQELLKKMQKDVALKIKVREYDKVTATIASSLKDAGSSLFPSLDEIILTFFPRFPEQFNELLREDSRFHLPDRTKLPVEMRIFALWRLGITKNEDIAHCLNYSLNTIKSYKTHVMNATDLENKEFYEKLMEITQQE